MERKILFVLVLSVLLLGSLVAHGEQQRLLAGERELVRISLAHVMERWVEPPEMRVVLDLVEEKYDIQFEAVYNIDGHGGMNSAAIQQIIQDILEGDTTTHLYVVHSNDIPNLMKEGLIQPLDEPIERIQYFENLPTIYRNWDFERHQGRTWAVSREPIANMVQGIMWNKDLFEREGFPNLYELYEAGAWTWDEFERIALAATRDTTGDGEIDQWGVTTFDHHHVAPKVAVAWAATNGGRPTVSIDGRETFAFNEPAALEAIDFWANLMEAGAVSLNTLWRFQQGNAAMMNYEIWMSTDHTWHGLNVMDDDWGLVPYPKGPRADEHIAPMTDAWVVVAPVHNPDAARSLEILSIVLQMNAKYADVDAIHDERIFLEYSMNHRDRTTDETMNWLIENMTYIPYLGILYDGGFITALGRVYNEGMSSSAAMAEIEPVIQALLDDIFEW